MILENASVWYLLQLGHLVIAWAVYIILSADDRDYGALFLITCYAGLSLATWQVVQGLYIHVVFGFIHALCGYILWFVGTKLWGMIVTVLFLILLMVDISFLSSYFYGELTGGLNYAHIKGALSHGMLLCAIFGRNQPDRFYAPIRNHPNIARRFPFISGRYKNL